MSTSSFAPTSRAISANFPWGISRGYALAPATISFGLCSRARLATWSKSSRFVAADAVMDELVEHARGVELHAVREVAAVGEVEGEHGVARLDGGQ
jgi:hypothetical protein